MPRVWFLPLGRWSRLWALVSCTLLSASAVWAQGLQQVPTPGVTAPSAEAPQNPQTAQAPQTPQEAIQLANQIFAGGRPAAGIRMIRDWLLREPKNAQLHLAIGKMYEVSGSSSEAADAYRLAAEYDPQLTEAHVLAGKLNLRMKLPRLAYINLNAARRLGGANPEVNLYMAQALLGMAESESGRTTGEATEAKFRDDAISVLNEAVRMAPQDPRYRYELGKALYITGRKDDGIDQMRIAVNQMLKQSRDKMDRNAYATIENALGELFSAMQSRASELEGDQQVDMIIQAGDALGKRSEVNFMRTVEERRVIMLQALQRNPNSVAGFLHYAQLCLTLGLKEEAVEALGRLSTLAPDDPRVQQLRQAIEGLPAQPQPVQQ